MCESSITCIDGCRGEIKGRDCVTVPFRHVSAVGSLKQWVFLKIKGSRHLWPDHRKKDAGVAVTSALVLIQTRLRFTLAQNSNVCSGADEF